MDKRTLQELETKTAYLRDEVSRHRIKAEEKNKKHSEIWESTRKITIVETPEQREEMDKLTDEINQHSLEMSKLNIEFEANHREWKISLAEEKKRIEQMRADIERTKATTEELKMKVKMTRAALKNLLEKADPRPNAVISVDVTEDDLVLDAGDHRSHAAKIADRLKNSMKRDKFVDADGKFEAAFADGSTLSVTVETEDTKELPEQAHHEVVLDENVKCIKCDTAMENVSDSTNEMKWHCHKCGANTIKILA